MRKPDKPSLRKALLPNTDLIEKDNLSPQIWYTIDGGALLHRVRWMKGWTFQKVAEHYVAYVKRHYGKEAYIVFDGYDKPSTKSNEHTRRAALNRCPNINIVEANTVQCTQDQFLSNEKNKVQLIQLISRFLLNDNHTVTQCDADADTKIVSTALELAILDETHDVVVVADDTDIAVMLLYHWKEELGEIIFYQERQQKGWSIKQAAERLGDLREHVLFVHAWSGCDTVSAPYGKGKLSFLNQVTKNELLKDVSVTTMNDAWAVQEDVGKASQTIFNIMYSGKERDTLIKLR